jgi:type IV fimbrial biogenesis protein FimT
MNGNNGFTLLELLVALGIVAILVSMGNPALRTLVLNSTRTQTVNSLVHSFHLARTSAIRNSHEVAICPRGIGDRCSRNRTGWAEGWLVFINADGDQPADRDPDEPLLLRRQGTPGARISSNRSSFRYKPFNRRSTNGTLVYCDDRGQAAARAVVISYTGRPRVTALTASGSSLDCSA